MKTSTTLQLLLAVSGVSGASIPRKESQGLSETKRDPLAVTENYVPLRKAAVPERLGRRDSSEGQLVLAANPSFPVAEVKFGSTTIPMLIDTGSSDIWIVKKGFNCVEKNGTSVNVKECNIPETISQTPSGGYIPNANLSITYGDQSFVHGPMAFEDVTVAGLAVKHQRIGVVDVVSTGAGGGDSSYSGLMGVSYPLLTSMVNTTTEQDVHYTPIVTNMIQQGLASSFSMALDRGVDTGGYMAFGGVPPVKTAGEWVTTPILKPITKNDDGTTTEGKNNTFYFAQGRLVLRHGSDGSIPTAYNVTNDFKHSDFFRTLVDSGTYLTTVPPTLASHIMTAYDPPARLNVVPGDASTYYAQCTAKPPFLGVQFNKNDASGVLWFDDKDMIEQDTAQTVGGKKWCQTGVQASSGDDDSILGDTWLHNIVAVFDVGNSSLHFAQRPMY